MRCILLWSAVVLVMLNLSCNSFDRPIVFVSTLLVCLTLFGVSLLLSHVRHPKHTVLAGAVLIVLMGLACLVSNENSGFQSLWLLFLPAMLLIQLGLKQAVPICSAYGLCAMVLLWGSPERLANAYPRDYRIYYPVFYWEFLLAMVVADLFYKSYRIRREQIEQEMEAEVQATMGKAQKLILSSVAAINQMIDEKDHYTSEHSRRVAQYSRIIAKHLDPTLSEEELERLYRSALLHDIGKIAVPDAILNKSSRLTDAEADVMRQHTLWGKKILAGLEFLPQADLGASYHHERYDGTGYPAGLMGEDLPRMVWVIAAADALDAMSSNRCYRKSCDLDYILSEFEQGRGTQFSPEVADAVIDLLKTGGIPLA